MQVFEITYDEVFFSFPSLWFLYYGDMMTHCPLVDREWESKHSEGEDLYNDFIFLLTVLYSVELKTKQ